MFSNEYAKPTQLIECLGLQRYFSVVVKILSIVTKFV